MMNTSRPAPETEDSQTRRFWREWLGNSLLFPILNILLEALVADPLYYLLSPTLVSLLGASALQAWALSHWQTQENPRRLLGNLIGPAAFTVIGLSLQGPEFLAAPNHVAYWFFGLLFGLLQSMRIANKGWRRAVRVMLEALLRGVMVITLYYILNARLNPTSLATIPNFLSNPERLYIVLAVLWLGLNAGLPAWSVRLPSKQAPEAPPQSEAHAAWSFGREAQGQALLNPAVGSARREERVILVMDIRGLAGWGEARQPEETASLLNRYYQTAEATLNQCQALKFRLRAGQVVAFFERVEDGLEAALKLRLQISALLNRHGLEIGLGLHSGLVLEAWLGGRDIKALDEVGAALNTARHIEHSAGPGELLVSEAVRIALGTTFRAGPKRAIPGAGQDEPLAVYPLQ